MKYLATVLLLVSTMGCICNKHLSSTIGQYSGIGQIDTNSFRLIETLNADLDQDGKQDTITLELLKDLEGDPQDFNKVSIKFANDKKFLINNCQGKSIPSSVKLNVQNQFSSNRLFGHQLPNGKVILIIWDYQYADCTSKIEVYEIWRKSISKSHDINLYAVSLLESEDKSYLTLSGYDPCVIPKKTMAIQIK